uniref:DUF5641 domain-containing protein n=1 Tax=Amphimedon queenslandica TaxID=400682 RepID=A0A1X7UB03_AMPQE
MLSDNAQTFKKMASLLKEIEDHKDVKHYFSDRKIQWNFNVEMSPWWGEVFERLIQSVKRCMKKVIGRASLTYEELLTAVIEIEMIINSLPLSYVTQDDLDEPITPSHLLIGRRLTSLPDDICCTEDDFTYWIQVGNIAVIHSDEKKRGFWSTGRVEELLTGRDGNVRPAVVRVYTGLRRSKLLRRPIQRFFPIEVHRDDQGDPELVEETQLPPSNEVEDITNIPCDNLTVDDSPSEEINTVQDSVVNDDLTINGPSEEINTVQDSVSSVVNDDEELVTNKRPRRAAAFAARDHIKAQSLILDTLQNATCSLRIRLSTLHVTRSTFFVAFCISVMTTDRQTYSSRSCGTC